MAEFKNQILDKVLLELGLDKNQVIDEGLMDKLKAFGSNVKDAVGNRASNVAAVPANVVRDVSNTVANRLQTDKAIINGGVLLVAPENGGFVGLKGVVPGSEQANYLLKQYQKKGYTPATPEQRMTANTQKITVHTPQQATGNLKPAVTKSLTDMENTVNDLQNQVAAKPIVTSDEAGGIFKQLVTGVKAGIQKAQSTMGVSNTPAVEQPPTTEPPTTGGEAQAAPTNANIQVQQQPQVATTLVPGQAPVEQTSSNPALQGAANVSPLRVQPAKSAILPVDTTAQGGPVTSTHDTGYVPPETGTPWIDKSGKFVRLTTDQVTKLPKEAQDAYYAQVQAQKAAGNTPRIPQPDLGPMPVANMGSKNGPLDFQASKQR